jgi:hypothetical protein
MRADPPKVVGQAFLDLPSHNPNFGFVDHSSLPFDAESSRNTTTATAAPIDTTNH